MAFDGSIRIDTSLDGSGFNKGVKGLASTAKTAIGGIVASIGAAGAALTVGAVAGVKYNAQMEQYITSFGTMLGSAEDAQKLVNNLKEMGAKTPFETADLAKGAQTLLAFGIANEKLLPTMKMIGDVSQGNKEKFNSLTLAFAQISSTGKLMGQDLLQCVNAGFNPLNEISKMTGKSVAELKDEMSKGAISADMVADAFEHATSEGGQFYNAMDAQSKTFNGQMSTLSDNAKSFVGELTANFSDKLKDTALPMVNGWLAELQGAFKAGGFTALSNSFGDVLAEAVAAVASEAPSVIESGAKVVSSFIQGIKSNIPSLGKSALEIVSALVSGVADVLPSEIRKPIKNAMSDIAKSFNDGGLKNAINTFKKLLGGAADVVGGLAKVALPVLTKAIDFLGKTSKVSVPLIGAVAVAITAWKIAQQSKEWIDTASTAIKLFALSSTASSGATTAATASLTISRLAYGVLSGQIGLATAAQTIFNAVLNANPIGLVITAAAGLCVAIGAICAIMDDTKEQTEQLNTSFDTVSSGFTGFSSGISTSKTHLSEFNDTLFASSEEQQALAANMEEVQNGITTICKTATAERRDYTQEEIVQLEQYFSKLNELNQAQFDMETARMNAVKQQAINNASMHKGSLAEYEVTAQEWIATAREQRDRTIDILSEQATTETALLNQKYGEQANDTNAAYVKELDAINANKQAKIDLITESVGEVTAAYANGYAERSGIQGMETLAIGRNNASIESENSRHTALIKRINADYVGDSNEKSMLIDDEELRHKENLAKIWADLTNNMTDEQKNQLGVYLNLAAQSELYGGKLTDEAAKTATGIISSFGSLPDDTREAMSNAMSPMLEEMSAAEPGLLAKAAGIANGILNTLKGAFDI
ncbi:MAG: tape measure protein, partial [Oscillospiraceae bacterium]